MAVFLPSNPPPFPKGEPRFLADLKSWKTLVPHWFRAPEAGELSLSGGLQLLSDFPDPEHLLDSAFDAWHRFAGKAGLQEAGAALRISFAPGFAGEDFKRTVSLEEIRILAGSAEGVRRALYGLIEDIAASPAPALPVGEISRHFWLRNRISRCFFGPIKRPPFNHDELLDDIDYYPEPYLDRLASEGINGLWLTVNWREIAETRFLPSDPQREKRLSKLRRTVERCCRYGIKTWIFCIEPRSWNDANILPDELKELGGDEFFGRNQCFCCRSELARQYLYDTAYSIFSNVPHLGGMMMISLGERPTSCLSNAGFHPEGRLSCQNKCGFSHAEILAHTLKPLRDGMRAANPEAEIMSWLYLPLLTSPEPWVYELPTQLDTGGINLAFNFESGCTKAQLGQVRVGGDYWLSCVGPSERFGRIAAKAQGHCGFAAKLQVGCSHEIATIPFIPVPGLLYRKYREMRKLGVSSVLQCWYFGNYPGLQNRTAGRLAYEDFSTDELTFLTGLAAPEWGAENAPLAAKAWQQFGRAYENYPLDIMVQYYGPMHDGITWPLYPARVNRRMTRSWKPETFAAGDITGEISRSFSLDELAELSRQLAFGWEEGLHTLQRLEKAFPGEEARQQDLILAEAISLLFSSGARILRFYQLRSRGMAACETEMRRIVQQEISASKRMIELCESDPRLGYHSEAEVYKFFPEKLRWRIAELEKLLALDWNTLQDVQPELRKTGTEYREKAFRWSVSRPEEDLFRITLIPEKLPEGTNNGSWHLMFLDASLEKHPHGVQYVEAEDRCYDQYDSAKALTLRKNGDTLVFEWRLPEFVQKRVLFGLCRTWHDREGKACGAGIGERHPDFDIRLCFGCLMPEDFVELQE